MSRSIRETPRRPSFLLFLAVSFASAAVLSGCGATTVESEGADQAQGKEIFSEKCGACHVLADAGTQGEVGPNLDDAFGYGRQQGFEESTVFEITLEQMEIPGPPMPDFDEPGTKDYLSEEERIAVAAYVAACAGRVPGLTNERKEFPDETGGAVNEGAGCTGGGGVDPEETDPKAIFLGSGCGSCHVLADAGTEGAVGPNLDESQMSLEQAIGQITNGGNGMPPFKDKLTEAQIRALAEYVTGG